jgi:hypothetical protein
MQNQTNNEILENAIQKVCNNHRIYNEDHIQEAVEIGRSLFTIIGEKEVIPIIGDGITKFWTLSDFISSHKKKLPAITKSKNDRRINKLDQIARSGDMAAYRAYRKEVKQS